MVSRSLPGGIPGIDTAHATWTGQRIERQLGEDDCVDTAVDVDEHLILDRLDLAPPLPGARDQTGVRPCLMVDGRSPDPPSILSIGRDAPVIPPVRETIEMSWQRSLPNAIGAWTQFTGESLDEIRATCTLLQTTTRLTLVLTAPMRAIIESSIALVDVLAQFMAHPVVKTLLPTSAPTSTWTGIDWIDPRPALAPGDPVQAFIGQAAGRSNPVCLDLEIRSAQHASRVIAEAFQEGRMTLAGLSRLSRRISKTR